MAPLIRVIGSINTDMLSVTPRFPELGETITSTSFTSSAGGKGANQAVACARLTRPRPSSSTSQLPSSTSTRHPVDVQMFGAVGGRDSNYEKLLQPSLRRSGVDLSLVSVKDDDHTGVSVIIMSTVEGDNRIFFSPGANFSGMQPTPGVIRQALAAPTPDLIVMQAEIPVETLVAILRGVRQHRLKDQQNGKRSILSGPEVVFNPAPVPPGGLPEDAFAAVDHLIMNETEADLMAPVPARLTLVLPGAEKEEKREQLARYYHGLGVTYVVVTLGSKGAWYSAADPSSSISVDGSNRYTGNVPAARVDKVTDTTAAGDTFVGGYSAYIARWRDSMRVEGKNIEELSAKEKYQDMVVAAMKLGTSAAARCVERSGAMDSIPWEDELQ